METSALYKEEQETSLLEEADKEADDSYVEVDLEAGVAMTP